MGVVEARSATDGPPSVALVYTRTTNVTGVFMDAIVQNVLLDDQNRELIGNRVHSQVGGIIAAVRNRSVEWFLKETDADWLWFVDADMGVGRYTLEDMLRAADGPCVVSAATWTMGANGRALTWARKDPEGTLLWVSNVDGPRMEIDACGGACTLIHRDVLEAVRSMREDDPWHWFGHDLVDGQRFGEDYTFCFRVKAAGYRIYGADTLVPHYKLMPL